MNIKKLLMVIFILSSGSAYADSLSMGSIRGGNIQGSSNTGQCRTGTITVDVAYELTSKGSGTIVLMAGRKSKSSSIGSAVVSRGNGRVTITGNIDEGCPNRFNVKWW